MGVLKVFVTPPLDIVMGLFSGVRACWREQDVLLSWCDEPLFERDGVILHFFARDRVIGQGLRKVGRGLFKT